MEKGMEVQGDDNRREDIHRTHLSAREYSHTITLHDGRTITGPVSALVYLKTDGHDNRPQHSRQTIDPSQADKGGVGEELKSLVYVKRITFGKSSAEGTGK